MLQKIQVKHSQPDRKKQCSIRKTDKQINRRNMKKRKKNVRFLVPTARVDRILKSCTRRLCSSES